MTRADDLLADYERLGELLANETDGAKAASLARERRLLGELVEALAAPKEASKVDELADRRASKPAPSRAPSRRRRSGGS